jgi:hypothetical protein
MSDIRNNPIDNVWFQILNPDEDAFYVPETIRLEYSKGIIKYGADNLFPDELLSIYWNSATLAGCIQRLALYTSGLGLEAFYPDGRPWPEVNEWMKIRDEGEGLNAAFAKCAIDRWLFGGFACKVAWYTSGDVGEIAHQDWTSCRYGFEKRDSEEINPEYKRGVWISPDWRYEESQAAFNAKFFEFFLGVNPEIEYTTNAEGKKVPIPPDTKFIYHRCHTPGFTFYPFSQTLTAMRFAKLEAELTNFMLNNTINSFSPSGVVDVPWEMKPEDRAAMLKDIKDYRGTGKVGKLFVSGGMDGKRVTYTPITANPTDKDVSNYMRAAQQGIITALGIPSPALIGLPGGASLSGDGNTIAQASRELYLRTIRPVQEEMLAVFTRAVRLGSLQGVPFSDVVLKVKQIDERFTIDTPVTPPANGAQTAIKRG